MSKLLDFFEVFASFACRYPLIALAMFCLAILFVWIVWSILKIRHYKS